jgi:alanine or glycine:cation symporter, AGCS family
VFFSPMKIWFLRCTLLCLSILGTADYGVVFSQEVPAASAADVGETSATTEISEATGEVAAGDIAIASSDAAPASGVAGVIARIDGVFAKANSVVAGALFYDFGTSSMPIFGAADISDQPAAEYFTGENKAIFTGQLPPIIEAFKIEKGRLPNSLGEVSAAAKVAGLELPKAPSGVAYDYNAESGTVMVKPRGASIPFVVVWLFLGGVFLTLRMGFINIRGFLHAIQLIRGKYDDPSEKGEVTHFQALSSALSATVGLGNIGGVAVAVGTGGPGATFWMIVVGLLGMSTKFAECTLGQIYRRVGPDGTVLGGPMRYLRDGLQNRTFLGAPLGGLGTVLAFVFALLCIGASFGGGNSYQVSQSLTAIKEAPGLDFLKTNPWVYGLLMSISVGLVIIGGIKSIGSVASRIVPVMCLAYVMACLWIIIAAWERVPMAITAIFTEAFHPQAMFAGGFWGVMVIGVRRAVFSNEAGAGSAAIAHSAAKTDEPVSEGIVALLEPFVDTVVVCTMTAVAIGVTGVYSTPAGQELASANQGAALTLLAFTTGGPAWFAYVLYASVILFAYSTCISWSYYGERCFVQLFGDSSSLVYKLLFIVFTFLGSVVTATNILDFSDLMILAMAVPNLLGVFLLSGVVREALNDYWRRFKSGQLEKRGPR